MRKLPEAFGLEATRSFYPHYFKMEENLDYICPMTGISNYVLDEKSDGERKE